MSIFIKYFIYHFQMQCGKDSAQAKTDWYVMCFVLENLIYGV